MDEYGGACSRDKYHKIENDIGSKFAPKFSTLKRLSSEGNATCNGQKVKLILQVMHLLAYGSHRQNN
jgi:hypothetical protein